MHFVFGKGSICFTFVTMFTRQNCGIKKGINHTVQLVGNVIGLASQRESRAMHCVLGRSMASLGNVQTLAWQLLDLQGYSEQSVKNSIGQFHCISCNVLVQCWLPCMRLMPHKSSPDTPSAF